MTTLRRESRRRRHAMLIVSVVIAMAAASCGSDDDVEPAAPTQAAETTAATQAAETTTTEAMAMDEPELTDATRVPTIRFMGPSAGYESPHFEANNRMFAEWEKLGISVETNLVPDWGGFSAAAELRDWDMAAAGYVGNIFRIDPDQLLSRPLYGEFAGSSNYGDWVNSEYDSLLEASKVELDVEARRELVWKLQEIQALDIPIVVTYHPSEVYTWNKDAYTNVIAGVGTGLYNFWNFRGAEPTGDDKIYRIAIEGFFRSINPTGANDYDSDVEIHNLVYDSLAKPDPTGQVVPWAAESWSFPEPSVVEVVIRSGMTFTDGTPVTAEDVKFSFDYLKEWEVGLYQNALAPVESVDVVDPLTVRINLDGPTATVTSGALSQVVILPKHIWESVVADEGLTHPSEWTETDMIGSGSYKVKSVSSEAVELERNDGHFDPPASEGHLTLYLADNQAVFRALQDGTIYFHQVASLTPAGATQAANEPHLELGEVGGITVRWTAFSMRDDSPFQDYHLRHALAHLYDYATTVDVILQGYGAPGQGTIGPGNTFWQNPNIPHEEMADDVPHWHQYDPAKARRILEDAGYRWDDEGNLHFPENHVPQLHYNG